MLPIAAQFSSASKENYRVQKSMSILQEWKFAIEESCSHCEVKIYVAEGNIPQKIQFAAKEIKPELIIIGESGRGNLFSFFKSVCSNQLAKSTECPVLTVATETLNKSFKIIVLPIGSFIPKRKIELATEFAKKYRATIHLVTIPEKIDLQDAKGNSFLETYRILKTGLTSPVEHHVLKGNNFPKAILEYAECIGADLILANPGSETKISNLTGKHINDVLTMSSKLKILSIEPYRENGFSPC